MEGGSTPVVPKLEPAQRVRDVYGTDSARVRCVTLAFDRDVERLAAE